MRTGPAPNLATQIMFGRMRKPLTPNHGVICDESGIFESICPA